MKAHIFTTIFSKKQRLIVATILAIVFVAMFGLVSSSHAQTGNLVIVTPDGPGGTPAQANTDFIYKFYAIGSSPDQITFQGFWWPVSDPTERHQLGTLAIRADNTIPNTQTRMEFDVPYNSVGILPATQYGYSIEDTNGLAYYTGSFTTPAGIAGGPSGMVVNGLTVSKAISSDGMTVTFTISGNPTHDDDVNFVFSYTSSANSLYGEEIQNFGTRQYDASAPQTLSFTVPTNSSGLVVDTTGSIIDLATIRYDLTDTELNLYAFGNFGSSSSSGSQGGAPVVTVAPKNAGGIKALFDKAPDLSGGLVPCDGRSSQSRCGWPEIVVLINRGMTWIIYMTIPIGAGMFAYAGFLFLTNGASEEARGKAKGIFINVAIGVIIILIAVLVVKTILAAFGVTGEYSSFL